VNERQEMLEALHGQPHSFRFPGQAQADAAERKVGLRLQVYLGSVSPKLHSPPRRQPTLCSAATPTHRTSVSRGVKRKRVVGA
jgi:hypothetical protein